MSDTYKLINELSTIDCIENNTKNTLVNIFDSWIKCKNNHIFIENIKDSTIKIGKTLEINGKNYDNNKLSVNSTIFIANCDNNIIKITNKFNHVIILKCNNTNIYISHGLVSGMDVIHSNYIKCNIKFSNIYYLACCNSDTFTIQIDECIANDILMVTSNSHKVIFKLYNGIEIKEYITNISYFSDLTYYAINENKLNYANSYGIGIAKEN